MARPLKPEPPVSSPWGEVAAKPTEWGRANARRCRAAPLHPFGVPLSRRERRRGGVGLGVLTLLLAAQAHAAPAPISVHVVVVTTFELGTDTGDTPGEFQAWVERLPLRDTLPFPAGTRPLRWNADKHVLGVVVGSGAINAAASVMALGLDPRFDLRHAYWVVAGIAGVDPDTGSVGSAAWAEWVVDRDLTHEIDAREIPAGWSTGLVPLTRSRPFESPAPAPGIFSPNAYHLQPGLVGWAYALTAGVRLDETADLAGIRARYPGHAAAQAPPHVLRGDEISASDWWVGWRMTHAAEAWMRYWTAGRGVAVTTAMEDAGVLRSLQLLTRAGRVDDRRVLVLRTASNYSAPGEGQTAADLIAAESSDNSATGLSAYRPALEAAWRVGSPVVEALTHGWNVYRDQPPTDHAAR